VGGRACTAHVDALWVEIHCGGGGWHRDWHLMDQQIQHQPELCEHSEAFHGCHLSCCVACDAQDKTTAETADGSERPTQHHATIRWAVCCTDAGPHLHGMRRCRRRSWASSTAGPARPSPAHDARSTHMLHTDAARSHQRCRLRHILQVGSHSCGTCNSTATSGQWNVHCRGYCMTSGRQGDGMDCNLLLEGTRQLCPALARSL